ncbi:hypothetical protein TNCV_440221 [Trichonephila clavipes]|nr:hypothetical protein TNCV_440221 [Trichonephila clavipes]
MCLSGTSGFQGEETVWKMMNEPSAQGDVGLSVSYASIADLEYCTIHGKKGAIACRRLDFYLLVHGRYFISILPPIGNQWRRSPIRHLGTRPLGVTGSPKGLPAMAAPNAEVCEC